MQSELGHEVRLIAAQLVRPLVKTNKTDAADAEAIWETVQRPGMRFVALKSEEQRNSKRCCRCTACGPSW